ncbi:MAG TPA: maleylpyruvate isomerase N-terminal domain-containing protein [Actinomycetes bacterium]
MGEWEALTALSKESRALSGVLLELDADAFERSTNCPPWNLKELVVHTAASIQLRGDFLDPQPGAQLRSAADYYRRPERATPQYRGRNVEQAQALAARLPAGMTAARMFEQVWRETVGKLRDQDPARTIQVPAVGAMRLADWTVTRVISVAAHGVDVALTLHRVPWTTSSALAVMREAFLSLLGAQPPKGLAWDDQLLLEVATGRRALSDQDRRILGPLRERFPLLS